MAKRRFEGFRRTNSCVEYRENLLAMVLKSKPLTVTEISLELRKYQFVIPDLEVLRYWLIVMAKHGRVRNGEKRDCTVTGKLLKTYEVTQTTRKGKSNDGKTKRLEIDEQLELFSGNQAHFGRGCGTALGHSA